MVINTGRLHPETLDKTPSAAEKARLGKGENDFL